MLTEIQRYLRLKGLRRNNYWASQIPLLAMLTPDSQFCLADSFEAFVAGMRTRSSQKGQGPHRIPGMERLPLPCKNYAVTSFLLYSLVAGSLFKMSRQSRLKVPSHRVTPAPPILVCDLNQRRHCASHSRYTHIYPGSGTTTCLTLKTRGANLAFSLLSG